MDEIIEILLLLAAVIILIVGIDLLFRKFEKKKHNPHDIDSKGKIQSEIDLAKGRATNYMRYTSQSPYGTRKM